MRVLTRVRYANSGESTLETSIPIQLVKHMDLKAGDNLEFEWDNRLNVRVSKVE